MGTGKSKISLVVLFVAVFSLLTALALVPPAFAVTINEDFKVTASDHEAGDRLGNSVSVDGDTTIVGVATDDNVGLNSGSAYVFTKSRTTWSEDRKLTASDAALNDQFGFSVSVSGDYIFVGAAFADNSVDSGSVYVYDPNSTPTEILGDNGEVLTHCNVP